MKVKLTVWWWVHLVLELCLLACILTGWKILGVGCWLLFEAFGYCAFKMNLRIIEHIERDTES